MKKVELVKKKIRLLKSRAKLNLVIARDIKDIKTGLINLFNKSKEDNVKFIDALTSVNIPETNLKPVIDKIESFDLKEDLKNISNILESISKFISGRKEISTLALERRIEDAIGAIRDNKPQKIDFKDLLSSIAKILDKIDSFKPLDKKEIEKLLDTLGDKFNRSISSIYIPQPPPASPPFQDERGQINRALIDDDRHVQVDVLSGAGGSTTKTDGQAIEASDTASIVAGKDGSGNAQFLTTDTDGNLQVDILNTSVPVTGTFWQATQPVSLATVPSHAVTNAGTFAVQESGAALTQLQTINSLTPAVYDYISLTYTGDNLTGVVFKVGGSGGTTISTLTLAYTGAVLNSVTKT